MKCTRGKTTYSFCGDEVNDLITQMMREIDKDQMRHVLGSNFTIPHEPTEPERFAIAKLVKVRAVTPKKLE